VFAFRVSPEDAAEVLVNPKVVWRSEQVETFLERRVTWRSTTFAQPSSAVR
jgi:hypothetical protein